MADMNENGIKLNRLELMILLNELSLRSTSLNVIYPFFNFFLFTVRTDDNGFILRKPVDKTSFNNARKKHLISGEFFEDDIPTYNDLRECYVVSGVIPYPNLDEVYRNIDTFLHTERTTGGSVFFGIDTNIAYLRFFTRNFPHTINGKRITLRDMKFLVSSVVEWELDRMIRDKYTGHQIRKMSERFSHGYLIEGFFNGSVKRSRRAKDAMAEIYHLRRRYGAVKTTLPEEDAEEIEGKKVSYTEYLKTIGKEERDRLIAESYSRFQSKKKVTVVLVTADEDMIAHAGTWDTTPLFVKYPPQYEPDEKAYSPWRISDLLYTISLRMGAVTIENHGIDIVGEWYGKDMDDYNRELVKVYFNGNPEIEKDLKRSLRISRKIVDTVGFGGDI